MNKLYVITLLIGFWFILPMPFMILNYSGFSTLTIDKMQDRMEKVKIAEMEMEDKNLEYTAWDRISLFFKNISVFIGTMLDILGTFLYIMLIGIPHAPILINYFLWLLRIITITTCFVLGRGN